MGQESEYSLPRPWALSRVSHQGCSHLKAQLQKNLLPSSWNGAVHRPQVPQRAAEALVPCHMKRCFSPSLPSWFLLWVWATGWEGTSYKLGSQFFNLFVPSPLSMTRFQGTIWVPFLKFSKGPGTSRDWQNHLSNLLPMPKWVPHPWTPNIR